MAGSRAIRQIIDAYNKRLSESLDSEASELEARLDLLKTRELVRTINKGVYRTPSKGFE
jgi:hypothetical protein